jgi:hypothetical protein
MVTPKKAAPSPNRSHAPEEVARALTASHGLVSVAARQLGCSRLAVHRHIKRSALVRQALEDAREALLDLAEASLYRQVAAGEGWAVCFILKTLGRDRGYVERREIAGPDGGPIVIRWPWEQYATTAASQNGVHHAELPTP